MSRDPLVVEVENRSRPYEALKLLRELVRLVGMGDLTLLHTPQSKQVWLKARELLAEEVPGTEVRR